MSKGSDTVRVVVIGAGNMGKNHLRTYKDIDNAELVGLSDVNPEAKQLANDYDIPFYTDYLEMIEDLKPDAVSIVVPTEFHFEIGKNVIERKINCLMEKPIASTADEGIELLELANKNNVIFTVGHIERYNPMIQKLKTIIDKKTIGSVTSILAKRVGGFPVIEPKTDVIIDLAVHDIDIISFLIGNEPKSIIGHGSRTFHSSKVDSAEIFLNYGDASGFIQANWVTPVKIRTIAVTGTLGYVEGNYITQELSVYKHRIEPSGESFKNFVKTMGDPEIEHISDTPKEPLKIELSSFIGAILNNDPKGLVRPIEAISALSIAREAIDGAAASN